MPYATEIACDGKENMMICNKNECTGCMACMNACPLQCIKTVTDEYGETHPAIDENRCIECGKCKKICPNNSQVTFIDPKIVYAAWRKDAEGLKNSASGGVGAVLAERWIRDGGLVCGTRYSDDFVPYISIESTDSGIERFKGSKYIQSETGYVYKQVKERLKEGNKVLFFGTPCQIAGLYSIVDRNAENLLTVEILCHGVSPYRYFESELEALKKEYRINDFDNVSFRTNQWMLDFYFTIWKNGKPIYERQAYENRYFSSFLSGLSLRESCYQCKFKEKQRVGDILIGDFIGLGKEIPFPGSSGHKSLILCMNKKGEGYISCCSSELNLIVRTLEEAVSGGRSLREPFPKHPGRECFKELVKDKGFIYAAEELLGSDIKEREQSNRKKELKRRFKLWMKYHLHIRIENRRLHYER